MIEEFDINKIKKCKIFEDKAVFGFPCGEKVNIKVRIEFDTPPNESKFVCDTITELLKILYYNTSYNFDGGV